MRKTALLLVIAVYGYAANAQLTLKPQAGIEIPGTKISYNGLPFFKPECQSSAQLGLRADYQFKGGFGPFLGIATHRPSVDFRFADPETALTSYTATKGDLQVQLQAGLQYSTRVLTFPKKTAAAKGNPGNLSEAAHHDPSYSGCRKKYNEERSAPQTNTWTVRLQPSAGLAYLPSDQPDLETSYSGASPGYTYHAGNIKTAFITGLGFEFARNKTRFLSLSINYFKGLGNQETSFTTERGGKTVTTTLRSEVSGWNAAVGVPLSFNKKSSVKSGKNYRKCGEYYKSRCGNYRKLS